MMGRRLLYMFALGSVVAFYLSHTGYFSFVLLLMALAFVPLELLVSLPALRGTTLELAVAEVKHTEAGLQFVLQCAAPARLAVGRLRAELQCHNLFTGGTLAKRLRLPAGATTELLLSDDGAQCGVVVFALRRPRQLDVAGLFSFAVKPPPEVKLLVPPPAPQQPPTLPDEALDLGSLPGGHAARPGPGALREYADIRDYRDGDALRDVHWKLSAKRDKLMVRERSDSPLASPHLCFDYYGEPTDVCRTLARVSELSARLWQLERLHGIHWRDAAGILQSRYVTASAEYHEVLWQLLEQPLPKSGSPIARQLPADPGPKMVVTPKNVQLYEYGRIKEVLP